MDFLSSDPVLWFVALWFLILGGAVGSFLNVVVYRLPAGLSIFWPPSHCPHCKHPVRGYDNVPVLGWLWLRGQCRDCGQPISARYPLVEALMACMALLLADVEILQQGHNLPLRALLETRQAAEYLEVQAVSICLLHFGLLSTLAASGLMALNGRRAPWRLFAPMMAAGCIAPIIWPWLHPQPSARVLPTHPGRA